MKTEHKILLGLSILGIGYFLWKRFGKKATTAIPPEATTDNVATLDSTSGISELKKKIMVIQAWLGVDVDGVAGPITNGAMSKRMPQNYQNWGPISAQNVDKYTAAISTADKQATNAVIEQQTAKRVQDIMAANGTVQLIQDYQAPILIFDKASGSYSFTGQKQSFSKGFLFEGWLKMNRGDKTILLSNGDNKRYEFSPYALIVV